MSRVSFLLVLVLFSPLTVFGQPVSGPEKDKVTETLDSIRAEYDKASNTLGWIDGLKATGTIAAAAFTAAGNLVSDEGASKGMQWVGLGISVIVLAGDYFSKNSASELARSKAILDAKITTLNKIGAAQKQALDDLAWVDKMGKYPSQAAEAAASLEKANKHRKVSVALYDDYFGITLEGDR